MWEYNYTPDPDELMHYGVRGMKWKEHKRKRAIQRQVTKESGSGKYFNAANKEFLKAFVNKGMANRAGRRMQRDKKLGFGDTNYKMHEKAYKRKASAYKKHLATGEAYMKKGQQAHYKGLKKVDKQMARDYKKRMKKKR